MDKGLNINHFIPFKEGAHIPSEKWLIATPIFPM
jgi:hypothetical protein